MLFRSTSCTAAFTKRAGIAALKGSMEPTAAMVAEFKRRRDVIVDGLNDIPGISCLRPHGAFYSFPNITETGYDCRTLAKKCMDEAGVAVLAGTAFGEYGEGYLRLSYANSVENIQKALVNIKAMLAGYAHRSGGAAYERRSRGRPQAKYPALLRRVFGGRMLHVTPLCGTRSYSASPEVSHLSSAGVSP